MKFSVIKIETFIPEEYVDALRKELNHIGALTIGGNYDNCMSYFLVTGSFRPLDGSNPFEGELNKLTITTEAKVEFCSRAELMEDIIETIKEVHPYEVPVINIIPVLNL